MENLSLSFHVIAPLLVLLAVGFLLRKLNFLSDAVTFSMNQLVALVFLPILVFHNIYKSNAGDLFNPQVLLLCILGIAAEFIAALLLVKKIEPDRRKCGVMLQGMFRSNYVIFGIPIAVSLFGTDGSSAASILTMAVIPMYNVLAVVALELFRTGKIRIINLLKRVITNPLILASLLGVLFSALQVKLPAFVAQPVASLAATATPLAFVFLGASFAFHSVKVHWKQLALTVFMRLVLFPLLLLGIAILLGVRGVWLVVMLALFASPTAISSFSLSQSMGADDRLAGNIVVFTSLFSIITMFIWIFTLKSLMLI